VNIGDTSGARILNHRPNYSRPRGIRVHCFGIQGRHQSGCQFGMHAALK